jgi:carbon-monoxide dehydrogenase medium subunit
VEFPRAERSAFFELARRHGDYAIVGVAAVQRGTERRFAFFGAGPTPVLFQGKSLEEVKAALDKRLDPPADLYNTAATKRHLAKVLLERAWKKLTTSH